MALHRAAGDAEDLTDVAGEVAFAPKELKVAQDLSERLGAYTYKARSQSRPGLFGKGSSSTTESDQRRPLLLPQELLQLPQDQLLVLRAGLPPLKAQKIVYWRDRAFTRRLVPAPERPPRPLPAAPPDDRLPSVSSSDRPASHAPQAPPHTQARDPLALELIVPALEAEGLEPLPPQGASPEQVEAWVARFIDASAQPPPHEAAHAR